MTPKNHGAKLPVQQLAILGELDTFSSLPTLYIFERGNVSPLGFLLSV